MCTSESSVSLEGVAGTVGDVSTDVISKMDDINADVDASVPDLPSAGKKSKSSKMFGGLNIFKKKSPSAKGEASGNCLFVIRQLLCDRRCRILEGSEENFFDLHSLHHWLRP